MLNDFTAEPNGKETMLIPGFEQECVQLFSNFLKVLGTPKSVGSIYGLLFASSEALCFADIVERLGMSKGSVSQGLAFLKESGAVRIRQKQGDRREFFVPELSLRHLAGGLLQHKVQPMTVESRLVVKRLRDDVDRAAGKDREFQLTRIEQLESWHRQIGLVIPVVKTLLAAIPR